MDFFSIENLLSLLILVGLEAVFAIDNIIYIIVSVHNLPLHEREKARTYGLATAIIFRMFMLILIFNLILLSKPFFKVMEIPVSVKSILYMLGGVFLIAKGISELRDLKNYHLNRINKQILNFKEVILQMSFINAILSFDSIMTAIAITKFLSVAVLSVIIITLIMYFFARRIGDFFYEYVSFKSLALCTIILIGIALIVAGVNSELNRTAIFCSIFFALFVEIINIFVLKSNNKTSAEG